MRSLLYTLLALCVSARALAATQCVTCPGRLLQNPGFDPGYLAPVYYAALEYDTFTPEASTVLCLTPGVYSWRDCAYDLRGDLIGYTAFSLDYDDPYPKPVFEKRSLGTGKLLDKRGLEECPTTITAYAAGGTSNSQSGLTACAVVDKPADPKPPVDPKPPTDPTPPKDPKPEETVCDSITDAVQVGCALVSLTSNALGEVSKPCEVIDGVETPIERLGGIIFDIAQRRETLDNLLAAYLNDDPFKLGLQASAVAAGYVVGILYGPEFAAIKGFCKLASRIELADSLCLGADGFTAAIDALACSPSRQREKRSLLSEKALRNRRRSHALVRREITPCQAFIDEFESLFGTEACGLRGAAIDCSRYSVASLTPLLGAGKAASFLEQCPVLAQSAQFYDITCALVDAARTIETNGFCGVDIPAKPGPSALARRKARRALALDDAGSLASK